MGELDWDKFDNEVIESVHSNIFFYRDLYEGNHSKIFERAKRLIEKGEIVDNLYHADMPNGVVKTPYVIANMCKVIVEIPATLVSRSIGRLQSSLSTDERTNETVNDAVDDLIDGPEDGTANEEITNLQQELITQLENNSNLPFEHWGNIVQQQMDGGLVGVPWLDDGGLRIDFKARDVYYPHSDGKGADLAFVIKKNGQEYLHIYRERVERRNEQGPDGQSQFKTDLVVSHKLYSLNAAKKTTPLTDQVAMQILGINELERTYKGRGRPFIKYWANEKTILNPLGSSALKNQAGKQDEVNWTLTRNGIVFERNGKPRLAVSKAVLKELQRKAMEKYNDPGAVDHEDLEIVAYDDNGKAMEVIQVDVTKIGDIGWAKDLIKLMLMETRTSEKALDFYTNETGGSRAAQSGVSKFYDLFTSLLKAEQVQKEYVFFLQELVESALWIANYHDEKVIPEKPEIPLQSMIPIARKELTEENDLAFKDGAQSLETTVRRNNPDASEDWIQEELQRIESERQSDDSYTLLNGRQTAAEMLGNRDAAGNPIGATNFDESGEGEEE